jgi:hypothetical protein
MPVPTSTIGVGITGEGMTHQYGVVSVGGQLAPGLIGHGDLFEHTTTLKHEGPAVGHIHETATTNRVTGLPGSRSGQVIGVGARMPGQVA